MQLFISAPSTAPRNLGAVLEAPVGRDDLSARLVSAGVLTLGRGACARARPDVRALRACMRVCIHTRAPAYF
jgi:hypothetical protein